MVFLIVVKLSVVSRHFLPRFQWPSDDQHWLSGVTPAEVAFFIPVELGVCMCTGLMIGVDSELFTDSKAVDYDTGVYLSSLFISACALVISHHICRVAVPCGLEIFHGCEILTVIVNLVPCRYRSPCK
jgi:hypothetical protein